MAAVPVAEQQRCSRSAVSSPMEPRPTRRRNRRPRPTPGRRERAAAGRARFRRPLRRRRPDAWAASDPRARPGRPPRLRRRPRRVARHAAPSAATSRNAVGNECERNGAHALAERRGARADPLARGHAARDLRSAAHRGRAVDPAEQRVAIRRKVLLPHGRRTIVSRTPDRPGRAAGAAVSDACRSRPWFG